MTSNVCATEVATKVFLSDIAGYEEEKQEAMKIINVIKNYDSLSKLGISIPKGLILAGPSGVGKTLLAKAIAGETNVPFYEFESSEGIDSKASISELKKLFKVAKENSPSIIFIDELDELVPSENFVSDYTRKSLKTLLTEIDGAKSSDGILVIATTNHIGAINPALLRSGRLDKHIEFDMPNINSRKAILDLYINKNKNLSKIDTLGIAKRTQGFSCADLKSLINETLLANVTKGIEKVVTKDFYNTIPEVGVKGIQKGTNKAPSDHTCFHEVGHFIVNYALKNNVGSISVVQVGNAKGMMMTTDEEDMIEAMHYGRSRISYTPVEKGTKTDLINIICVSMAGNLAEDYFLKEVSSGALSDIKQIDLTIESMFINGMFGIERAIKHNMRQSKLESEEELTIIDQLIKDCKEKVINVFIEYDGLIKLLAKEVKERQKLDADEAKEIIKEYSQMA